MCQGLTTTTNTANSNNNDDDDDDDNNNNNNNNSKFLEFKTTYLMTRFKIANHIILHCRRVFTPTGRSPEATSGQRLG